MKKGFIFCRYFLVLLPFLAAACSSDGSILQLLTRTAQAPVFLECKPISSTELVFKFSTPVRLVSFRFDPAIEVTSTEEGEEVRVTFAGDTEIGQRITADILVEDAARNSLNVIVPFRTRNDRMPMLVLNELRTEYSRPRVEFIEFLVLKSGNMGAMRLFISGNSLTEPIYEFPPAEVRAGEYILLHLRSIEDGTVDETGSNLNLASAPGAQAGVRDFWVNRTTKPLHKTSALWLMDQDDVILDALVLSESPEDWGKNNTVDAAKFLAGKGAWLPRSGSVTDSEWIPGHIDAVSTRGATLTRTICRDESVPPMRRAGVWYVTATSNATPGEANSARRHSP